MRLTSLVVKKIALFSALALFVAPTFAQTSTDILPQDMTSLVKSYCISENASNENQLKSANELLNAVETGKFHSTQQFKKAFETVLETKVRSDLSSQDRGFTSSITSYSKVIPEMDKDNNLVTSINEKNKGGMLFNDIDSTIPATYKKTIELCKKFNPKNKTNDNKKLSNDIDEYLDFMAQTEIIKYALKITESSISDLKKNWFGSGLGFEHVFAGESKGSSVSGYHFWYKFYVDERNDSAWYDRTLEGANDPCIFTGKFSWDPDGKGNKFKRAYKRKGGFVTQASPEAILALGHIAIEVAKKNNCPSAFKFTAAVNDGVYLWQMFTTGGSIRSLYPMVINNKTREQEMLEAKELVVDHIMTTEFANDNSVELAK